MVVVLLFIIAYCWCDVNHSSLFLSNFLSVYDFLPSLVLRFLALRFVSLIRFFSILTSSYVTNILGWVRTWHPCSVGNGGLGRRCWGCWSRVAVDGGVGRPLPLVVRHVVVVLGVWTVNGLGTLIHLLIIWHVLVVPIAVVCRASTY